MAYLRAQGGSPNDEIAIGLIGCGGMGNGNMKNFLNIKGVRVVAVCDVDANRRKAEKQRAAMDAYRAMTLNSAAPIKHIQKPN